MAKGTMPRKETGVFLRDDSNVYQWNITIPKELRSLYPFPKFRCSLGTSKLVEANRKAAELRAEWLAKFEKDRRQLKPAKLERITPDMAQFLAATALHGILESNEEYRCSPSDQERLLGWMRSMGMPGADTAQDLISWTAAHGTPASDPLGGMPESVAEMFKTLNARLDEQVGRALATGNLRAALPGMQYVAQRHGIVLDGDTPGIVDALRVYLRAIKKATEAKVERDEGQVVETPPAPSLKQIEAEQPRKLRDVFDRWKASKGEANDNVRKKELALIAYEKQTGNPPLKGLKRDQGEAFKTWLLNQEGASKTKHDRLDAVKVLLNYASVELEWIAKNPWARLDIPYRTENKRLPWTEAQVKAFFSLPLFTKYELPKTTVRNGGPAAYWIPLLGLFSGARVGELCQLGVTDVVERDGIAFISINDEAEGATVKTDAGFREVPIHSELLRLGFLEYVDMMREAGEERLWPALKFRDGKPGSYFSGWFGDVRKQLEQKVPDFHSLRHTVRSKMANAPIPVPVDVMDRITGHETKGSTGVTTYTHRPTAILKDAIEKVTYPELKLPRVFEVPAVELAKAA